MSRDNKIVAAIITAAAMTVVGIVTWSRARSPVDADELTRSPTAMIAPPAAPLESPPDNPTLGVSRVRLMNLFQREENGAFNFEAHRTWSYFGKAENLPVALQINGADDRVERIQFWLFVGTDASTPDVLGAMDLLGKLIAELFRDKAAASTAIFATLGPALAQAPQTIRVEDRVVSVSRNAEHGINVVEFSPAAP